MSLGAVMAFTGMLGASLLREGTPTLLVVPIMLLVGAAMGLVIGILVQYFDVQPFIASLAVMFAARGLAFLVSLKSIESTLRCTGFGKFSSSANASGVPSGTSTADA